MNSNNITKPKDIIGIFLIIIGGGILIGVLLYYAAIPFSSEYEDKINIECDEYIRLHPDPLMQNIPKRCLYYFYHNMDTGNSLPFRTK